MEAFGRDYGTLVNYKTIAKKFEFPRRRGNLEHKHHIEVAALDPDLADELLGKVENRGGHGNKTATRCLA